MPIRLKRSGIAGKAPSIADLLPGELAINTADGKLYTRTSADGAEAIVEVGETALAAIRAALGQKLDRSVIPSGTRMLFQQETAPPGWTKDTSHNDKALRVVSGSAGSGGTLAFSAAMANRSIDGWTSAGAINGWVGYTTLSWNEMPVHGHPWQGQYSRQGTYSSSESGGFPTGLGGVANRGPWTGAPSSAQGQQIGGAGASWGHTHGFGNDPHSHVTGAWLNMTVQYVDLIIATKD